MPGEAEEVFRSEWEDEEEGGGPVKTFLEHLEDLRWVLIKSGVAVILGMLVCLLGANRIVNILLLPLEKARSYLPKPEHAIVLWLGSKHLQTIDIKELGPSGLKAFQVFSAASSGVESVKKEQPRFVHLGIQPELVGTNVILTLRQLPEPPGKFDPGGPKLIFLTPAAPFMVSLKIAFFGGLVLSFPFVLYFVGEFVVPALKRKEKEFLSRALGVGIGLFILGALFCYFVMIPVALSAAVAFSEWLKVPVQNWMADSYFSLVVLFMGAMGLGFEFPVILLGLVKLDILTYEQLASMRRYAIVICLVIGALLTPPDVVTQVLMALPLVVLFEIAIWIARYWQWLERRKAQKSG